MAQKRHRRTDATAAAQATNRHRANLQVGRRGGSRAAILRAAPDGASQAASADSGTRAPRQGAASQPAQAITACGTGR